MDKISTAYAIARLFTWVLIGACAHPLAGLAQQPPAASVPSAPQAVGLPMEFSLHHPDGSQLMQVKLLGMLSLTNPAGAHVNELSGLAWDADRGVLYAVANSGYLVYLQPQFTEINGSPRLTNTLWLATHPLQDWQGKPLDLASSDAEGLAIRRARDGNSDNAQLLISFEGYQRIMRYTPQGKLVGEVELPEVLRDPQAYRGRNTKLEAVAYHPSLGVLTVPQEPLAGLPRDKHRLYDMHGAAWEFPAISDDYTAITDMTVAADGTVLVLERKYYNLLATITFDIRQLKLVASDPGEVLPVKATDIFRFRNSEGFLIDNFEGLCHHEGNRYFLVSDDNQSAIQKTLLLYFEIIPPQHSHDPSEINRR